MPVITDFGSAADVRTVVDSRKKALEVQEYASINSTISYRAPELLDTPSECVIGEPSDIWAFGCTIYAMLYSRTPFETPAEGVTPLAILSGRYTHPATDGGNTPTTNVEYLRELIDASLKTDPAARAAAQELREMFPATRSESDRRLRISSFDSNDDQGEEVEDGEQRKSGYHSPPRMESPRHNNYAIMTIPEDAEIAEEPAQEEPEEIATMRIDVQVLRPRGFPKRIVKKTAHLMMTHTSITLLKGGMHESFRNLKFYGTTILGRSVVVKESNNPNFEYGLIISGEPFLLQQQLANHRDGELDDRGSIWEVGFPSADTRAEWMAEIERRCQLQIQELNERRSTLSRNTFGRTTMGRTTFGQAVA